MAYRGYTYFKDENGNAWIMDHVHGFRYPLFDHPEVDETYTEEQLKKVCEDIDNTIINGFLKSHDADKFDSEIRKIEKLK